MHPMDVPGRQREQLAAALLPNAGFRFVRGLTIEHVRGVR